MLTPRDKENIRGIVVLKVKDKLADLWCDCFKGECVSGMGYDNDEANDYAKEVINSIKETII